MPFAPVQSMVGNNRFVYFGWNNYDGESTGLGRMDLSTFIDTQAPALTSDLMVTQSFIMNASRTINVGTIDGTIDVLAGATLTIPGSISGTSGGMYYAGGGTTILTGTSSYTGATQVGPWNFIGGSGPAPSGGRLQIGNGTTNGTISGAIAVAGVLTRLARP